MWPFLKCRTTSPAQRAAYLREVAEVLRKYEKELALMDSINTRNPVSEMLMDAADNLGYFAGLTYQIKGDTIALANGALHMTLREPLGVNWPNCCS